MAVRIAQQKHTLNTADMHTKWPMVIALRNSKRSRLE